MEIQGRKKKNKDEFTKTEKEIMLYLLFWLYQGQSPTVKILCRDIDVSERTFYRYMSELKEAGLFPDYKKEYQRWRDKKRKIHWEMVMCLCEETDNNNTEAKKPAKPANPEHIDVLKRMAAALDDCMPRFYEYKHMWDAEEFDEEEEPPTLWKYIGPSIIGYRRLLEENFPEMKLSDRTLQRDLCSLKRIFEYSDWIERPCF